MSVALLRNAAIERRGPHHHRRIAGLGRSTLQRAMSRGLLNAAG
jgi:hypothetical protein